MSATLVIMAAGLASRYGGAKQIEKVGPCGEILMEYSIYDAVKAGFNKVVIILKPEMENDFREICGRRLEANLDVKYAFQSFDSLPAWFTVPEGRVKPYGTVAAVLSAADVITDKFGVINADDYYGPGAYRLMYETLKSIPETGRSAMVAYKLKNTVSDFGTVTRGVCSVEDGFMTRITETFKIGKAADGSVRSFDGSEEGIPLDTESAVSMNFFGFSKSALQGMDSYFDAFLRSEKGKELKSECLLPTMIGDWIREDKTKVIARTTDEVWFGMTYQEDRATTAAMLRRLTEEGKYPEILF